jgi:plasmid maintenance system killer protein
MAIEFRDRGTQDIYNGVDSKAAHKVCPPDLVRRARAKLFLIDDAETIEDLRVPPGNRLEALKGERRCLASCACSRSQSTTRTSTPISARKRIYPRLRA